MLLPDNIRPENTVFYHGAFVLECLRRDTPVNLFDLYAAAKHRTSLSFPTYVLCLDWLYLLGVAIVTEDGEVVLCS